MAKWRVDGDQDLVFPTLGLLVAPGDVFDGPDDLVADGVSKATAKAKATVNADVPPVDATPVAEATPDVALANAPIVPDATTADAPADATPVTTEPAPAE